MAAGFRPICVCQRTDLPTCGQEDDAGVVNAWWLRGQGRRHTGTGLAPVFVLHGLTRPTRLGFHLSFWTGLGLGVALTLNWIPQSWAIGDGKYALLLGTNLYGLGLCVLGYLLPGWLLQRKAGKA